MAEQFLTVSDRQKLARIIENVYDMQMGPAARFGLLDRAGLRRFVPGTDLAQSPGVLAGVLIGKLETYGLLPTPPGQPVYHALGAVLNCVRELSDTPPDEAKVLAEALVKYELIGDAEFLAKLRADYGLDVQPVRQIDPAVLPPTGMPDLAAAPDFDPEVGDQESLERIVNSEDNFLDIDVLAGAIYTAQAVGRIELPEKKAHGTGFRVGPDLILTNYHVFQSKDVLEAAVIRFDYQAKANGVVTQGRVFKFVPDFYISSPDKELDFALVRVKGEPLAERKMQPGDEALDYLELLRRGRHRGYLLVSPSFIVANERINIIQHPNGNPQKVVLTQNYVLTNMSDERVHYLAETLPGSSGSPVLNSKWEVVALHHSGGAHPPEKASPDLKRFLKGQFKFNEGIPMRAILPKIERYLPRK